MDRRNETPKESGFLKDLEVDAEDEYDDRISYNGKNYRVPYKMIKEVVFTNVKQDEMKDIEHAARLQYRLLLMDPILKAKVEFIRGKITIIYNPVGADNRKEKIALRDLIEFLKKEGVNIDQNGITERDYDYVEEIFKYQFDPASIREHAPYSYTLKEWKKMKPKWQERNDRVNHEKLEKFHLWQNKYLEDHPELAKEYNYTIPEKKPSIKERIFGQGKKKEKEKEKGFWFHGA